MANSSISAALRALILILLVGPFASRPALAQALVRMTDKDQADTLQVAGAPPAAPGASLEEDRLIEAYRREAGAVGPRKWFSEYHLSVSGTIGEAYDDNILVSAAQSKEADFVTTLAIGVAGAVGDYQQKEGTYAALDYQATATLFGQHGEEDAVDHAASLAGQYRWNDLAARLESRFQSLHDTSADLGQRIQRSVYDESLDLLYAIGAYTRVEAAVKFNDSVYDSPINTQDLSAEIGADYEFFNKLRLGGELTFGRTESTGGVHEDYQQFQLRFGYELTDLIKITGRLGVELRQRDGGVENTADPVFSLEATWTPFDGTSFGLAGYRRVDASASIVGDDILETGLRFSLRQRLVSRFYAQLDGEYTHAEYQDAVNGSSPAQRTDNYYLLRGAVGYDFVDWLKVQVFCQRRQDDSTLADFSFDSTRSGVQVDLAY